MPIAPFIPLIASGINIAYDVFSGRKQRQEFAETQERLAREDLEFRKMQYQDQLATWEKYVKEVRAQLSTPTYKYNQANVDAKIKQVELAVNERFERARPQVLEGLSTRGVRTAGIGEEALGQLDQERTRTIADASADLTIEELLAERNARVARDSEKLAFSQSLLNPGGVQYSPQPTQNNLNQAKIESAYLPLYNRDIMNKYINQAGLAATYGFSELDKGNNINETLKTVSTNSTKVAGVDGVKSLEVY